ncbi:MAG: GNAT family N-acetyltransferase [Clostridia bacterium]|nr:GNAT family N-acetyltransferase [Clostridia bacterium]
MYGLNDSDFFKDTGRLFKMWGSEAIMLDMAQDWLCINVENATAVVFQNLSIDPTIVFFGYISFPDDVHIADRLFTAIEQWAKEKKALKIVGPVNYATWVNYRWMTEGWEHPPVAPETDNPQYMPEIAEKLGYSICSTYSSSLVKACDTDFIDYEDRYRKLIKEGYVFETYAGKESLFAVDDMHKISQAFSKNPYYCHVPYDVFKNSYVQSLVKEDTVVDICIKNRQICAYCVNYVNKPFEDWWVLKSIAVMQEHQGKNIGSGLRYLLHKHALDAGCSGVVHHYRFDGNISMKLAKSGTIIKRYALFSKKLEY